MLPAILTQHDHALAVDLGDDPQHDAFPALEGYFQAHPQLTQRLEIFLIPQFVDAPSVSLVVQLAI
ncbi:hypothetical protein [Marinobacter salarius]|jgi:hypothetical protein|uniref:Uncharacterized protein n=1 Tax=Marinobacter salarius TaxID=1420917 RepID=W5YWM0_9GAMM|nr:hypothetical protein [Marinobacter salarius]AHI33440.1 hypothetical protein AU15_21345 [Marinobacter salarius]AZR43554.1 hypothetical protein MTMN5_04129 [Marinobacter salarius]